MHRQDPTWLPKGAPKWKHTNSCQKVRERQRVMGFRNMALHTGYLLEYHSQLLRYGAVVASTNEPSFCHIGNKISFILLTENWKRKRCKYLFNKSVSHASALWYYGPSLNTSKQKKNSYKKSKNVLKFNSTRDSPLTT